MKSWEAVSGLIAIALVFIVLGGCSGETFYTFIEGGNKDVELIIYTDLDHLFRPPPDEPSIDPYFEKRGPIAAEVVQKIVDWIKDILC